MYIHAKAKLLFLYEGNLISSSSKLKDGCVVSEWVWAPQSSSRGFSFLITLNFSLPYFRWFSKNKKISTLQETKSFEKISTVFIILKFWNLKTVKINRIFFFKFLKNLDWNVRIMIFLFSKWLKLNSSFEGWNMRVLVWQICTLHLLSLIFLFFLMTFNLNHGRVICVLYVCI